MYAYFTGASRLPAPDETNILVESYSDGWAWVIPLHTGETSVGFVMDSKAGQAAIAEWGLESAFSTQVEATRKTRELLTGAIRTADPRVIRDWSYLSDKVAGDGYVLVGDAACFIDPLFSTGVHLALSAGVLGAAYTHTALSSPEMRPAAATAYEQLYYQQYFLFRELAQLFYASNRVVDSYFWEARRIIGDESLAPRAAFIRAAAGQSPKGYERMVFEHGEPPLGIRQAIEAIEGERAERTREMAALQARDGKASLLASRPLLAPGVSVERQAVLGDGEFVWGNVITVAGRTDSVPVSAPIGRIVAAIDGASTLGELVTRSAGDSSPDVAARLAEVAVQAAGILYVDGIISELREQ
jgi:hypothetical protein